MKKLLLSCLSLVVLSSAAKAQVTFGIEGGLNMCDYKLDVPGFLSPTTAWVPGAHIGGIVDHSFNDKLSLQPGLFYSLNGIIYSYNFPALGSLETEAHFHTIHIPVNVEYKTGKPGSGRFFVGGGPFATVNMGGSGTFRLSAGSMFGGVSIDSAATLSVGSAKTDYIKRFDFGLGVNTGYEFLNGFFVRGLVQKGLINLSPAGDGTTLKSMNYRISVGYFFRKAVANKKTGKE